MRMYWTALKLLYARCVYNCDISYISFAATRCDMYVQKWDIKRLTVLVVLKH